MPRPLPRVAALSLVAALLLAACGDDHDHTETTGASADHDHAAVTTTGATTPTVAAASGATAATAATGAPSTTVAGTVIEVVYKGGKVTGGGRKQVTKGETVTLRVTADVVDEVHLHGYDKMIDTVANQPVDLVFKADASGVFEAELEKKGLKLVEIEVR